MLPGERLQGVKWWSGNPRVTRTTARPLPRRVQRARTCPASRTRRGRSSASRPRSRCWRPCCCWSGSRRSSSRPARYQTDEETGAPVPGTYHELSSCTPKTPRTPLLTLFPEGRRATAAAEAAAAPRPPRPPLASHASTRRSPSASSSCGTLPPNGLYGVEIGQRVRRAVGGGLPLRLGRHLPVRPGRRRVHHRHDEDRGDPDRHRPAGAAVPAQRLRPDRDPDAGLRPRRHVVRHVGGDARLLRAARAARARAGLRPDGGGGDHLPRRRGAA